MLGVLLAAIVRSERALDIARRWQGTANWLAVALIVLQFADFWGAAGETWRLRQGNNIISLAMICTQYPLINLAMVCLLLNIFTRETGPIRWVLKTEALTA